MFWIFLVALIILSLPVLTFIVWLVWDILSYHHEIEKENTRNAL